MKSVIIPLFFYSFFFPVLYAGPCHSKTAANEVVKMVSQPTIQNPKPSALNNEERRNSESPTIVEPIAIQPHKPRVSVRNSEVRVAIMKIRRKNSLSKSQNREIAHSLTILEFMREDNQKKARLAMRSRLNGYPRKA